MYLEYSLNILLHIKLEITQNALLENKICQILKLLYFIDRIEIIVIFLKLKFSILPIKNNNSDFGLNNYIDNKYKRIEVI